MKRQCTEAENRILKECAGDVLTRPETYKAVFKSSFLPVILKAVAALGLGVVAELKLSASIEIWIRFILFIWIVIFILILNLFISIPEKFQLVLRRSLMPIVFGATIGLSLGKANAAKLSVSMETWICLMILICVAVIVGLFVLIWYVNNPKRIYKKRLPGDKFWVNGGTIIRIIYSKAGAYFIFAEDDLMDIKGNPCCIEYPASCCENVRYGERIILVYSDSGAYIPLRVTERTRDLIPEYAPEYFYKVNWKEAEVIPHPAAIDMDYRSSRMYEYERAEVVKKCKKLKNIRIKNSIGIVLVSVLILFPFALLFIGLVAEEVIKEFSTAVIFFSFLVLGWLFLTFLFAKAILARCNRETEKIQYKKKVMFHSVNSAYDEGNMYTKYISVYEYINGVVQLVSYPIKSNIFWTKKIPYGKIIYKYSQDKNSCTKDLNFFGLMS